MNRTIKFCFPQKLFLLRQRSSGGAVPTSNLETDEEGFRILDLKKVKASGPERKRREPAPVLPPRETRMAVDQKWSNVWPGPRTFHPASVPLPVRQGANKLGASPSKWGNAELMKIPNFLHLTPDAVKEHCAAIKKFCTPWPQELTDEEIKLKLPLEVISTDYCHSAPTIRNPLSRIVTIKFPFSKLKLDEHAKDKFLRLVCEKYNKETDIVTIIADKCPLKKQNYDYSIYLLTALYHESWVKEPWENEKTEEDLEYYDWEHSKSKLNVSRLYETTGETNKMDSAAVENYKHAVVAIFDEGDNDYNWNKYKESSVNVLFSYL